MARPPRIDLPGIPQHLWVRGNNRGPMFFDDSDRYVFMRCLDFAKKKYGCDLHAFVLMTNHMHLLATGKEQGAISSMIQSIGRRFVRYTNGRRTRTGTLFEGRFKSSLVDTEHYFMTCMRYIELNPVRAGMVSSPGRYPWSSYRMNARGDPMEPLTPHPTYLALGDGEKARGAAYRELFKTPISDEDLKSIRAALSQSRAWGSEEFYEQLEAELDQPVKWTPHGGAREETAAYQVL